MPRFRPSFEELEDRTMFSASPLGLTTIPPLRNFYVAQQLRSVLSPAAEHAAGMITIEHRSMSPNITVRAQHLAPNDVLVIHGEDGAETKVSLGSSGEYVMLLPGKGNHFTAKIIDSKGHEHTLSPIDRNSDQNDSEEIADATDDEGDSGEADDKGEERHEVAEEPKETHEAPEVEVHHQKHAEHPHHHHHHEHEEDEEEDGDDPFHETKKQPEHAEGHEGQTEAHGFSHHHEENPQAEAKVGVRSDSRPPAGEALTFHISSGFFDNPLAASLVHNPMSPGELANIALVIQGAAYESSPKDVTRRNQWGHKQAH